MRALESMCGSALCLLYRAGHSLLGGCGIWRSDCCLAALCLHGVHASLDSLHEPRATPLQLRPPSGESRPRLDANCGSGIKFC